MFEDSTFESNGRLRTRSRAWMFASLAFNGSILLALVLVPLLFPPALPRQMISYLLDIPTPEPVAEPKPQALPKNAVVIQSEMAGSHIFAPSVIPQLIAIAERPEVLPRIDIGDWGDRSGALGGADNPFGSENRRPVVRRDVNTPVRVPSTNVAGLLVQKTIPVYPPIARAARMQGTVILEAAISRAGTIDHLRVDSGPAMLQQAALDAVKTWRYRPYLLNGEPVEVETTVNVVFTLDR
jgi:protein TonB